MALRLLPARPPWLPASQRSTSTSARTGSRSWPSCPASEEPEAYHRRERRSGSFTRSIQLPYRIDPDRIEAHLENGVLRLSLPRPQEDKPRRIAVSGG